MRVKTKTSVAAGLFFAVCACAQAADTPVPKAELQRLISGKTIVSAGANLYYGKDGSYTYNGAHPGKYRVDTGRICVDFDNGRARCDQIVKDAGKYYLIDRQGARYQFTQ